jgi:hypothetical protein
VLAAGQRVRSERGGTERSIGLLDLKCIHQVLRHSNTPDPVWLRYSGSPLSIYMARIASGGLPKAPNQRS